MTFRPIYTLLAFAAISAAQTAPSVDRVLDQLIRQEGDLVGLLNRHSPLVETYIQQISGTGERRPDNDHYFLGRLTVGDGIEYHSITGRNDTGKRSQGQFLPRGFAQMAVIDAASFNRRTYIFSFVKREFLGEVRCLVFDVRPAEEKAGGRFVGRIWAEDRDYHVVRFNGTYTRGKNWRWNPMAATDRYLHFDSWRVNVGPGLWAPSNIYVEEAGDNAGRGFKAQTRIWGYNAGAAARTQELTRMLIESESRVSDPAASKDASPLESQRSWERQAEENVMDRLEKAGLIAPQGDVERVLDTVINNLIVTNKLTVDARCRVLLTTPLETFSLGQTIVISRGLIDVLPDEASLAMVLAGELAHIALGHRTDTQFAFHNQTMLSDPELLQRFRFERTPAELAEAGRKAGEMLENSPYQGKLANASLFLRALASRAGSLPRLIHANLGNGLAVRDALTAKAPPLAEEALEQITALPLGSRVKLDPWSNRITLVKTRAVSLLSAREKMPFEVTPFMLHLTRFQQSGESARGDAAR